MAKRRRADATYLHFLALDKADNTIVLQLVAKPVGHLSRKERVMFQTVQEIIAGVSLRDESCNSSSNLTQLDGLCTTVRSAEEN